MILHLQEFLRSTNSRWFIACGTANRLNPVPQGGIGNMCTIPGDQVIHAMDRGHSDMQGIYLGIGGQGDMREQGFCASCWTVSVMSKWGRSASTAKRR